MRLSWAAIVLLRRLAPVASPARAGAPGLVAIFGVTLGLMNLTFYEALRPHPARRRGDDRVPSARSRWRRCSRRRLTSSVALATLGIVLLAAPCVGGGLDAVGSPSR